MSNRRDVLERTLAMLSYARPTLDTIEKYALAVGARVEIRVRPCR